jgi:hypothetical protein
MAKLTLLENVSAVCANVALLVVVSDSDRVIVALLAFVNVIVGIMVKLLDTPPTDAVLVVRSCVMDLEIMLLNDEVRDATVTLLSVDNDHVEVRSSWQKHPSLDAAASATSFQRPFRFD